jgi:hypothetical protein
MPMWVPWPRRVAAADMPRSVALQGVLPSSGPKVLQSPIFHRLHYVGCRNTVNQAIVILQGREFRLER